MDKKLYDDYDGAFGFWHGSGAPRPARVIGRGTEDRLDIKLLDGEQETVYEFPYVELFYADDETIAEYADGSGTYKIARHGATLTTVINGDETIEQDLTRVEDRDDTDYTDWVLADRFAATVDDPDYGYVVWIDGLAFQAELG